MTLLFFVLLLLVRFASRVHGAQTFSPAAIPYAVRTPYLNTWMNTPVNSNIPSDWPTFWGGQITGWIFYIQVDGKTYSLFGTSAAQGNDSVTAGALLETELTPTRTIHVLEAGHMNVTLTFLSPITPSDLVRQSLPFTYLAVDLASTDGQPHSVQLYSDITGEWLSGDRSQEMTWSPPTQTGDMIYHQLKLVTSSAFQENGHQAVDGTAYYAMGLEQGRNITWQTCPAGPCREEFISGGGVNANENDSTNRAINNDYPAFAISVNLGNVSSVNSHIVWVVGYVRDPNIDYTLSGNTTSLRPYYTTNFSTIESALEFVVADFNNSLTQAMAFDADIQSAASEISPQGELYDMLSLATRQVFSSLEITAPYQIGQTGGATRIFMKDLGITRRVTPVETLYAALPMFLYFNNGSLVKPLLVPLLEQQNVSISRYPSAAKDLGETFPAVTGPNLVSQEGIEQTGNMLIIALAHARYSNDTSLLLDYYALFKNWALYLTDNNNALYPNDQTSIDDGSTSPNSTNLAVKGIFAIQAMAEISQLVGQTNDSQRFSSIASSLIGTWQSLALSPGDGTVLVTYAGQPASWVLPYNLYVQTLLGFNLVNQTIFDKLTVTYGQWIGSPSNGYTYGLPIESSESSPGNPGMRSSLLPRPTTQSAINSSLRSGTMHRITREVHRSAYCTTSIKGPSRTDRRAPH
ncbi:uncharacterized protein C8Q71DRAFT_319596 [Rhodofomes roseus]|uniref:DUF1793-domain-containing protein n=1 Tax=Rhodofomes roseus TaxID=34475 RepID=A0ABQ8K1S8_9APHY|nr:uncharacterized protein C8Q71DRAFT_319596 [Rhodofomes roseus]KAH9830721.1 hypothetical protein C8Q71DRAFT_319596 [Rhodofomes roseus]